MEEAINFFRAFEIWIYVLLGLVVLFYARKFILSWQELRGAGFGLERENAQSRLNQSAIILVLLILFAIAEFTLVTFVAPAMPVTQLLPTPTISLLATATATISAETTQSANLIPTAILEGAPTPVSGCLPGEIEIISPQNGQEVSGVVEVLGIADIPNFGFYKLEMKLPDAPNWLTMQAGNVIVQQGKLGDWDTRALSPGEYQLGLVVIDNQARLSPSCVVQVRVVRVAGANLSP